jgi:H+/Cl- antiporter ClcA
VTGADVETRGPGVVRLTVVAAVVGVLDGLLFLGFEWLVNHGTDWLWNDVLDTDERRWLVVVVAAGLSIGFSLVLRALRQPRWLEPHTDPMAGVERSTTATLQDVTVVFVVGLVSLLAGASLGPEAPLVGVCAAVGAWLAGRGRADAAAPVLVLASVGALLIVFVGSLVALAIPLLLLYQRRRALPFRLVVPIVVCGVAAYATEWLIRGGHVEGYGSIPAPPDVARHDYVAGVVVGLATVLVALGLRRGVAAMAPITRRVDQRLPWPASAALFGVVLGLLYLVGGQTVEFSGSAGTTMLLGRAEDYSAVVLLALAVVKLVASAWCLASGYRGGPIFPSIYAGVAISLFVARVASGLEGPGVLIGAVAGILTALTNPVMAIVFVVALLPVDLLAVAAAGVVGAAAGGRAVKVVAARRAAEA